MKTKEFEGKKYKFKKNSINKAKNKYSSTYNYVLTKILRYKKYINGFNNAICYENEKELFDKNLVKAIESIGKDFNIDNTKVYSYNKFNKQLIKKINKTLKMEKKNNIKINLKVMKLYKKIANEEYKDLRKIAIEKPNDFLKALYLYTICED